MAIFTSPGKVMKGWENSKDIEKDSTFKTKKSEFYCKLCAMKRPERSHHCKVCKMCVLKMDHHCPWIANCVGYDNQKYFFLFLFYSTFGTLFISLSLGTKIETAFDINQKGRTFRNDTNNSLQKNSTNFSVSTNQSDSTFNNTSSLMEVYTYFQTPLMIIFGCVLSGILSLVIGLLLFHQTNLISNNLTSVESRIYKIKEENPLYYPDKILCLSLVLGFNKWIWFWPKFEKNVFNNGFSYMKPSLDHPFFKYHREPAFKGNFQQLQGEVEMSNRSSDINKQ
jgi:hypothetical protein